MLTATKNHRSTEAPVHRTFHATLISETPRVLIVEDDPDVQNGWSIVLGHHGYDVMATADGAAGLGMIEDEEPDVVVLDLGLPGMHGQKILHELRVRGLAAKVVVVTASLAPDVEVRARKNGAQAVLSKPVSPAVLINVIEQLLD